jgi:hypothetical protein
MKAVLKFIVASVILVVAVFIWQGCCTSDLKFSGKVVDKAGKGIPEAVVKVGEKEEKTDKNGQFEICVSRKDKTEKYILSASKLEFGFFSRVYADTATHLIITLTKATVVTVHPDQDITVQDTNPDISTPDDSPGAPMNPLDTLPLVYNAKGSLIGFKRPPSLISASQAIANFQPPVLGAQIQIPAGSLVFEEERNEKPEDSIQVSVNTIDVYSPDGMPGNFTVDRGKNQRAYMQTFGAASIEAYYKGKPLQLGDGKTATLTIPVDTLSIISKRSIPNQIPLLIYNTATGYWNESGTATLNATKDAYVTTVSHFSTYNMDLEKTTPSCLQLCVELAEGETLDIFPDPATGLADMTWLNAGVPDCPDPGNPSTVTDCSAYGITLMNTSGVMNIENNISINIDVVRGGSPVASYVVNSGPQPTGFPSPDDYQKCNWNDCAGPFKISNLVPCWENKDGMGKGLGTTAGPILAVEQIGATTKYKFSILFIESYNATTGAITINPNTRYQVQYKVIPAGVSNYTNTTGWGNLIDFDSNSGNIRNIATPPATPGNWLMEEVDVEFTSPNPTLSGDNIFFRVVVDLTGTATSPFLATGSEPVYAFVIESGLEASFDAATSWCPIN